jgi:hypothetical protein
MPPAAVKLMYSLGKCQLKSPHIYHVAKYGHSLANFSLKSPLTLTRITVKYPQ